MMRAGGVREPARWGSDAQQKGEAIRSFADIRPRPRISLAGKRLVHNRCDQNALGRGHEPARVVLRRDLISVACTDVEPEALRWLLAEYDKAFPKTLDEIVLQEGCS